MIGVILLNMGGPDSLESIKPFLKNLFSDRDIIRLGPPFLQKFIASIIITKRLKSVKEAYSLIGGKSPLFDITKAQAEALENLLNSEIKDQKFKVYIGMRYWHPFIEEAVKDMYNDGVRKIIALSLYPHYSKTTTGSSIKAFKRAIMNTYKCEGIGDQNYCINCPPVTIKIVDTWYDNPFYIDALVEKIQKAMENFKERPVVLFSAHSLPKRFVDEGDPYVEHTMATIKAIKDKIDIDWYLSFQSKTGPVEWLEPSTEDKLLDLSKKGIKNVIIVPISFISDHIETLYEIDILYKKMAHDLGINMVRTESLNTSPLFIKALSDIVIKNIKALKDE